MVDDNNKEILKVEAKEKIFDIRKQLKAIAPHQDYDIGKIAQADIKEGYLNGLSINRIILILRSKGCAWALKEEGGCNMCGHYYGTTRGDEIPEDIYIKQFIQEFQKYDWEKYPMLCLYNSGSFLNDEEISSDARRKILEIIAKEENIKALVIESRPEFITEEKASQIREILGDKRVEVGIGLETYNDVVRDLCLNKNYTFLDFTNSVNILKKYDLKTLAYVLIKPPFLNEYEGIEDAITTAKEAFKAGVDVVSFEPVSIQSFTLTHYLYEAEKFRPPWIWSVLEVAKATKDIGFIRLGGFEFMPVPQVFTHNCSLCNAKVITEIQKFDKSYISDGFDNLDCQCKSEWEKELEKQSQYYGDPNVIEERIINTLNNIDQRAIFERIRNKKSWRFMIPPDRERNVRYW